MSGSNADSEADEIRRLWTLRLRSRLWCSTKIGLVLMGVANSSQEKA
jgi:hypothetical protein